MTVMEDAVSRADEPAGITEPLRPIRVAVFGLGRSGLQHAAVLSTITNVELVAIGDPDSAARRNARGMGLGARAYPSLPVLLKRATPEALFVATPFDERMPAAKMALEAGVAVHLDGTPALPAAVLSSLLRQAEDKGRAAACALPLTHHPVFAAASRIATSGTLGAVREVRASRYVSRVFHTEQQREYADQGATRGVIAHTGAELVFLLLQMFGMPREVEASSSKLYGALEDDARGGWKLDRTRLAFEVSWSAPGYPRPATVIEIESDAGRMLVSEDALELDLMAPRNGYPSGVTRIGRADVPQLARFELDGEARWLDDAMFLAWVTGAEDSPTRMAAVLDAARVIDALYTSASEGGRRVGIES